MSKCQYILERDLPPHAKADELTRIEKACGQRSTTQLGRSAKDSIAAWTVPEYELRGAIIRHIKAGRRMYHKYKNNRSGDLIPDDVQANVTLSENFDIYVEIWLAEDCMIVIYAHDHRSGEPRLPQ